MKIHKKYVKMNLWQEFLETTTTTIIIIMMNYLEMLENIKKYLFIFIF